VFVKGRQSYVDRGGKFVWNPAA
ncbi:MAG: hypothetical protein QOJ99_1846, partial [Bryobacterales bacterium]|nr:hypothetical protein [Bryobacterales bacterium]